MTADGIEIADAGWLAALSPRGGCVLSLIHDGADVLRAAPEARSAAADPRLAACFPCVPYFGRVAGALDVAGRRATLAPTLTADDPRNALHGEGWISTWAVVSKGAASARLRLDHAGRAPGRFPYPYRAELLAEALAGGPRLTLSLENAGSETMPAGLALHPYFVRAQGTELTFSAGSMWTPGAPGAVGPCAPDFARGAAIPEAGLDHSFLDWDRAVRIETPAGVVRIEAEAPILHVYAPPEADFFCLEPVTHAPGGFVPETAGEAARFCRRLGADETMSITMRIALEA